MGFLQFDCRPSINSSFEQQRQSLYRIPADAIRFCQVESIGQQIHPLIRWSPRPIDPYGRAAGKRRRQESGRQTVPGAATTSTAAAGRSARTPRGGRAAGLVSGNSRTDHAPSVAEQFAEDDRGGDLAYVCGHPPRCLVAFRTAAVAATGRLDGHGESINSFFEVHCPCGSKQHQVLCFPLVHPESREVEFMYGPIALRLARCAAARSELFDAKQHGYDAEHGTAPTCLCGEGERTVFACPHCQATNFGVVARFEYSSDGLYDDEDRRVSNGREELFHMVHPLRPLCRLLEGNAHRGN